VVVWAGIDEAGYGPLLGPLVVAGTVFGVPAMPREGILWDVLRDAVTRCAPGVAGRLVVDDSKKVYSAASGLKRLEEGALSFLRVCVPLPQTVRELLSVLNCAPQEPLPPWFKGVLDMKIPLWSNVSAVESRAAELMQALGEAGVRMLQVRACIVLPEEFNRIVSHTRNKSLLLFQKCGLLLQGVWDLSPAGTSFVLVDRHGGRLRYRRLLRDAFPQMPCDIIREGQDGSVYRITGDRGTLTIAFKKGGDRLALPVALASMMAKYLRELFMLAFNRYWQERVAGLRSTAGYPKDARRFIREIRPALEADGIDPAHVIRCK